MLLRVFSADGKENTKEKFAVKDDTKGSEKDVPLLSWHFPPNCTKLCLPTLNAQYLWLRQRVPVPSHQQLCRTRAVLRHPFTQPTNRGVYEVNTNWA